MTTVSNRSIHYAFGYSKSVGYQVRIVDMLDGIPCGRRVGSGETKAEALANAWEQMKASYAHTSYHPETFLTYDHGRVSLDWLHSHFGYTEPQGGKLLNPELIAPHITPSVSRIGALVGHTKAGVTHYSMRIRKGGQGYETYYDEHLAAEFGGVFTYMTAPNLPALTLRLREGSAA